MVQIFDLLWGLHHFTFIMILWNRLSPVSSWDVSGRRQVTRHGQGSLGSQWWGLEARRCPHIPRNADKGPLVIHWSSWQQMALPHLLHQEPAAKPAVTLERLPLTRWALGQFSVFCRQMFGFPRSSWFPLSSLTPIKGLAEYSSKEARRVKFINDCGKFGFHGCQQLLCRLRWVEITAQGCYFVRWQDTITNDKLNSLLQQGEGISLCEPGAYLAGEAALSGFLLFFPQLCWC